MSTLADYDPRPEFRPAWSTCNHVSCAGAQVTGSDFCFVHMPKDQRNEFLQNEVGHKPGMVDLDMRGTTLEVGDIATLIKSSRDLRERRLQFRSGNFDYCLILDDFDLNGRDLFAGQLSFDHAWFEKNVRISVLSRGLSLRAAKVTGRTLLESSTPRRLDRDELAGKSGDDFYATILKANFPGPVDLHDAVFEGKVEIKVSDVGVNCVGSRFAKGVTMRVFQGEVDLSGAALDAQSSLIGTPSRGRPQDLVRLKSVNGVDLGNLVLIDVDLRECRFAGSYNLEQLRIEGVIPFNRPPDWWRTRRRVIAEENEWRGWTGSKYESIGADRVGAIYRALRKSFEDSKFEAGAGDFYYGEMQARQKSSSSRRAERVILWFYWLLSGYGQRAGRALTALLIVIAGVTAVLALWDKPFGDAARIALGAVVLRDDRETLSPMGEWTVLVARFLGPPLLALALLAIRARVKR